MGSAVLPNAAAVKAHEAGRRFTGESSAARHLAFPRSLLHTGGATKSNQHWLVTAAPPGEAGLAAPFLRASTDDIPPPAVCSHIGTEADLLPFNSTRQPSGRRPAWRCPIRAAPWRVPEAAITADPVAFVCLTVPPPSPHAQPRTRLMMVPRDKHRGPESALPLNARGFVPKVGFRSRCNGTWPATRSPRHRRSPQALRPRTSLDGDRTCRMADGRVHETSPTAWRTRGRPSSSTS